MTDVFQPFQTEVATLSSEDSTTIVNTATTPVFVRGTDGTTAFDLPKQTQFPSALVGGRLDVNVGNTPSVKLKDGAGTDLTSTLVLGKQALDVNIANSITTTSGAADKTAFTYGTTSQQTVGGVFQDTSPGLTAGQEGAVRVTQNRAFHSNLRNDSGSEVGIAAAPLRIDPTGTTAQPASQSGTWTVQPGNTANTTPWLIKIDQTGANNDVDVLTLPAVTQGTSPWVVSGTVAATQSGTWTVQPGNTANTTAWLVDVSDRVARILGHVRIQDDAGNALTSQTSGGQRALDVGINVAGVQVDPRAIRALTSSDVVDVSDRAARLVGRVYGSQGNQLLQTPTNFNLQTEIAVGATLIDPRSIRALTSSDVVDVSDRAARLVGKVYGSQSQILTQTATNFNLQVETAVGGTLIDPRVQGTAAALSGAWPVKVTDGTNTMPTMDVVTRAGFHKLTDGVDTLDVVGAGDALGTTKGLLVFGSDGSNVRPLLTGNTGRLQVDGIVAIAGGQFLDNAVASLGTDKGAIAMGFDGANYQFLGSDTDGDLGVAGFLQSSFSPDPSSIEGSLSGMFIDASSNLQVRGQVLSDEGSFRDDFIGSSLTTALTGTLSFTNNSTVVSGAGTLFTTELVVGQFIKKTADGEANYVRVETIVSDTSLVVATPYPGTTASTTGVKSNWFTTTVGGASATVGSSLVNLISSTASGNAISITRNGDYLPYNLLFKASITQRIANQTAIFGFQDSISAPSQQAIFQFDGAVNTTVKCISSGSSAAADTQTTTATLPSSATTAAVNSYQIDVTSNQVTFTVNGTIVAVHKDHLPNPYTILQITAKISNAAVVTTTTMSIDLAYFANLDQLQITNDFTGEPLKVQLMGKQSGTGLPVDLNLDSSGNLIVASTPSPNTFFRFGDVTTTVIALAVVRRTTYTEQTTNAQRSINSSSAADTAAGTGARAVKITYYDATGAGPFTETVTLNGVTNVNTTNTNICFIEKMDVTAVGSGGVNAGTLTLHSAIAGGGVVIGTIAIGDNQTFWAHHYVATGLTFKLTGMSCGHNGTTVGSGGLFFLKSLPIGVSNVPEVQISDFVRLYGQSSTFARSYNSPIAVTGPARIIMYVTPETASSTVYRAAFDFFEG